MVMIYYIQVNIVVYTKLLFLYVLIVLKKNLIIAISGTHIDANCKTSHLN